jgi:unsaturated chondroitin disaccharide hydrolase
MIIKSFRNLFLSALFFLSSLFAQSVQQLPLRHVIIDALDFSVQQSLRMAHSLEHRPAALPKTVGWDGHLETCTSSWWTSGFFPGTLWYLYEYSGSDSLKKYAKEFTARVSKEQWTTDSHDIGFIINCSFGNGYRVTGDSSYRIVLGTAARSLATRFNPAVGCIRSWDYAEWNKRWRFPVIIDNMMNLELLMVAHKEFHDPAYSFIAVSHANNTLQNHFRPDYSSYHVVSYNPETGSVQAKQTAQGYSDSSSWARGQAWGLYGCTMMYRFTKDTAYLTRARHIADFIIHHPRLPQDKIPYWDFDAPKIPDENRDASSGAIICSALIELSTYVPAMTKQEYLSVAEIQIRTLSSLQYRAALGTNGNFILKHSVGNMPNHTEIDAPLSYTDYYFVEALMRMKKVRGMYQ